MALCLLLLPVAQAVAVEFDFSGYVDARVIASAEEKNWVQGGLGKFRFGSDRDNFRFVEAVGQLQASLSDEVSAVAVARAEPTDSAGLDFLEAYALTPSAINTWIGEELRTMGAEGTWRFNSGNAGSFSLIGAIICHNDEAGILIADRGWGLHRKDGLSVQLTTSQAQLSARYSLN